MGPPFLLDWFPNLKMEVRLFSETSAYIRATRRYIPAGGNFRLQMMLKMDSFTHIPWSYGFLE
jgi:hypothetical protein